MLCWAQATIKEDAPIAGQTIKDGRFRSRFDAAVVHIRRGGRQLEGQLGRTQLRSGDEVLMSAGVTFDSTTSDALANFTDVRFVKAPYKQFMMPMVVPEVRLTFPCAWYPIGTLFVSFV